MLARASYRHLLRHPWLAVLSVVGIALGVAVAVAVDIANTSATRAFDVSSEALTGRATHQIVAGPAGVAGAAYTPLALHPGVAAAAPVIEGFARSPADTTRMLQVLGVDLFAEAPFRTYLDPGEGFDLAALVATPGAALASTATAERLGVEPGAPFRLSVGGRDVSAVLTGVLDPTDARTQMALTDLLVVDIATAQEWLGMTGPERGGRLTRIDVILDDDAAPEDIAEALPPGTELRPAAAQAETLRTMTAAFRQNLTALSLLALVVGVFLIYNAITFLVVQRRRLIGTYRALGVSRREIFRMVLLEAGVLGVVGTAAGLALGVVLGQGLVQLVTQSISDLYFVVRVREAALAPEVLAKGAAIGMGSTLLAAVRPAYEAATSPAATALRRSSAEAALGRRAGLLAIVGLVTAGLGAALLVLSSGIAAAYVGLLAIIVACGLAAPWATRLFARLTAAVAERIFGPVGRMAARGVAAALSRTAVAVAALAVAVAATVGVGVMVQSFRATVVDWLEASLVADVYVQPDSPVFRRGGGTIAPELVAELTALEGVARVETVRIRQVNFEGQSIDVVGARHDPTRAERIRMYRTLPGGVAGSLAAVDDGDVLVTEPFAHRFDVSVGDSVVLPTDRGALAFTVAGIYYDYASDLGVVSMADATFRTVFDGDGVAGVALFAEAGTTPEDLTARARTVTADVPGMEVRSNRGLREASIEIFDRTFVVTSVLRLLAVLVAFVGVLSALMAIQLERRRELAVLRAQGMSPGEVGGMVGIQTGLLGLLAGILALPLGLLLAAVLVFVINKRSFGWTLNWQVPPELLIQAVILAIGAALLAGIYPAWKMSRTPAAEALREMEA